MKDSAASALPDLALADVADVSDHKHEAINAAACPFYLQATGKSFRFISCCNTVEQISCGLGTWLQTRRA